jgi:hypothetical protein
MTALLLRRNPSSLNAAFSPLFFCFYRSQGAGQQELVGEKKEWGFLRGQKEGQKR